MFGFFEDVLTDGLDVIDGLLDGELPSKRQVAKMIDAGLTIYAVSEATGFAVDVLENILED